MARKLSSAALACALMLVLAASAVAKGPPRGTYVCDSKGAYYDQKPRLKIRTRRRYLWNTGHVSDTGGGKFRVVGRRIRFRTGVLRGLYRYRGRWDRTAEGKPRIRLRGNGTPWNCVKR